MIRAVVAACAAWSTRRPLTVLVGVVAISGLAALALPRLRLDSGIYELFPSRPGPSADLAAYARALEQRPELVVLLSGTDPHRVEQATRKLSALLRASPLMAEVSERIPRSVLSGPLGRSLVLLAGPRARARIRHRLGPGAAAGARKLRRAMLSPFPPPRELVTGDPMGLGELLLEGSDGRFNPTGSGLYASSDGKAALIFARPRGEPSDLEFCARLQRQLQKLGEGLGQPSVRVQLTGGYIYAHHLSKVLRRDLMVSSAAALVGAALVLFFLLRSIRLLPVAMAVSGLAVLWTLALAAVTVGRLNALSLCFAALCIGMGMDAMIHVTSRARELAARPLGRRLIPEALSSVSPALLAASLTTMAAFATFALSSFAGFSQTGLLAACGLGLTLGLTLVLFPALAALTGLAPAHHGAVLDKLLTRLVGWVPRHRWPILGVALTLGAVGALAATGLEFSEDLTALAPAQLPPVETDRDIARAFGRQHSRLIVLARGQNLEQVLQANDRVAARLRGMQDQRLVTGFSSLSTLLPARRTQRRRLARWKALDPPRMVRRVRDALAEEGLKPEAFSDFFAALLHPRVLGRSDLPPALTPLVGRHLARLSGEWLIATVVHQARGRGVRLATLEALGGSGARVSVTGAAVAGPDAARLLREDLLRIAPLTLLAVLVVLGLLLRRVGLVLATMASLGLSGVLFAGGLRLLGLEIDLYNLMVIPVIIGYGVDDHIYVVRRAREDGLDAAIVGSGRAVITTTLTTMVAFGALALCTLPGLRSLGLTAVLGIGLGQVTSLVVMPALLSILAAHGRQQ